MKKHEFLEELRRRLSALPQGERDKAYAFYAEIIDDSIDDGMSEEEAIAKLGNLDEIVERIVAEVPMGALLKHKVAGNRRGANAGVLLALGVPLWLPLLAAVFSVILTLFVALWILALALWVLFASGAAAAATGVVMLLHNADFALQLLSAGGAMAGAGFAALLFPAALRVTRLFARTTRRLWGKLKNTLLKRRGTIR